MKVHIFSDNGYIGTISIINAKPELHFPIGSATSRITIQRQKDIANEPVYYASKEQLKYITGWI